MEKRHVLFIPCSYDDESIIDQAISTIKNWSLEYEGRRRYGWIKKAPAKITFFIDLPLDHIPPSQSALLYSALVEIPGLGFLCQTFN